MEGELQPATTRRKKNGGGGGPTGAWLLFVVCM